MICRYDKEIREWIRAHKEEILEDHMALCRIPSVRGEAEENAPYGKECARALQASADLFEKNGFSVRVEKERGYALARLEKGEKTIGIYGHSDVVPAGDGWIKTEPFEPRVIDGVLYGRGVGDNKAGVIQSLYAMRMIKELELPLNCTVQAFIGSNEESGMGDIVSFAQNEKMPEVNLAPDSSYPCSTGEKGILRIWTKCRTPLTDILDFDGGDAANIVMDHVTVRLTKKADLKEELSALIAERSEFVLTEEADALVLEANGVSKHAAHPEDSLNAAWLAFALLSDVKALCEEDRKIMKHSADAIACPYGEGLGVAHEDPAFGKLTSVCGMTRNENGYLKINMDIRYGNTFDPEQLEKKLEEKWNSIGFDTVDLNNRPGYKIPDDNPIPVLLCAAYKELTGVESEPKLLSGGTYSRALKNSYSIGFRAPDPDSTVEWPELPAGHGHAHQRDEAIILDQFYQSLRVVTNFILACDQELSK
ncbi:MAG: Sapep family Mn(2+)-dependent dipeptidase [Clostridia bacterium]|nr:Sapep family Mn(2+)-dependent dipeptidase [Clostridia bacterium]